MSIKDKLRAVKALLSSVKLSQEPLLDGTLIEYSGDQISANEIIYKIEGAENINVLPDGAYVTKSNTNFTIANGVVSSVNTKIEPNTPTGPVLQAQSSQEEVSEVTEVVEEAPVELALESAPVATETPAAEVTPTVDVCDVIDLKMQTMWDAIYGIQNTLVDVQNTLSGLAQLYVSQGMFSKVEAEFSKTQNAVNKLTDVVNILANEPASAPLETEVTSFSSVPKGQPKMDKNISILQGI